MHIVLATHYTKHGCGDLQGDVSGLWPDLNQKDPKLYKNHHFLVCDFSAFRLSVSGTFKACLGFRV